MKKISLFLGVSAALLLIGCPSPKSNVNGSFVPLTSEDGMIPMSEMDADFKWDIGVTDGKAMLFIFDRLGGVFNQYTFSFNTKDIKKESVGDLYLLYVLTVSTNEDKTLKAFIKVLEQSIASKKEKKVYVYVKLYKEKDIIGHFSGEYTEKIENAEPIKQSIGSKIPQKQH